MNKFKGLALGTSLALMAGLFTAAPVAAWHPEVKQECNDNFRSVSTVTLKLDKTYGRYSLNGNEWISYVNNEQIIVIGNAVLRMQQKGKYDWQWSNSLVTDIEAIDCHEVIIKEVPVEVIKEIPVEVIKEVPVDRVVERIVQAPIPDRYEPFASLSEVCGDPRIKARMDNSMSTLPASFKVIWNRGKDGLRSVKHFNLAPGQVKVTDWIWVKGGGSFVRIRDQYQELLASVRVFSGLPWGTGTCQK